ncbi:MAG: hypothetical protein RI897_3387 [Verrucomicrobiota bacterium]|jgi:hypothetical protein
MFQEKQDKPLVIGFECREKQGTLRVPDSCASLDQRLGKSGVQPALDRSFQRGPPPGVPAVYICACSQQLVQLSDRLLWIHGACQNEFRAENCVQTRVITFP